MYCVKMTSFVKTKVCFKLKYRKINISLNFDLVYSLVFVGFCSVVKSLYSKIRHNFTTKQYPKNLNLLGFLCFTDFSIDISSSPLFSAFLRKSWMYEYSFINSYLMNQIENRPFIPILLDDNFVLTWKIENNV